MMPGLLLLLHDTMTTHEPAAATGMLKGQLTKPRTSTTASSIAPNRRGTDGSMLGALGLSAPRPPPAQHRPHRRRSLADGLQSGVATTGRTETDLRLIAAAAVGTASVPGDRALVLAGGIEPGTMTVAPPTSTSGVIANEAGAATVSNTVFGAGRADGTMLTRIRDTALLLVTRPPRNLRQLEEQRTPHSRPRTFTCPRLPSPPLQIRGSCICASSVRM